MISVKKTNDNNNETSYPCLKEFPETGRVVLFTEKGRGINIYNGIDTISPHLRPFEYSDDWDEKNTVLYRKTIELSNKGI